MAAPLSSRRANSRRAFAATESAAAEWPRRRRRARGTAAAACMRTKSAADMAPSAGLVRRWRPCSVPDFACAPSPCPSRGCARARCTRPPTTTAAAVALRPPSVSAAVARRSESRAASGADKWIAAPQHSDCRATATVTATAAGGGRGCRRRRRCCCCRVPLRVTVSPPLPCSPPPLVATEEARTA